VKLASTLRTRFAAISLATITAAVTLTGTAAAASDATGYARCPAARFCVFSGVNGGGVIAYFTNGDGDLGDSSGPQGLNNNIESVWNRRSGEVWCLFPNAGYGGAAVAVTYSSQGSNLDTPSRNIMSSLTWCLR
jgi:hypothetical protein